LNNIDLDTDENTLINNRFNVTNSKKTLFPVNIYAYPDKTSVEALTYKVESESSLESDLKLLHKRVVDSKDDNFLISPAIFKSTSGRKKNEIHYCWCLMLDVDGGDMSPEDLSSALAGIKMYCFSTFSGKKNRYRVLIPVSHKLSADAYEDIFKSIVSIVEDWLKKSSSGNSKLNTTPPFHKIDPCSKYPSQIYFAPCQPDRAIGSNGFFKKFDGETIDVLELLFRPYHDEIYGPKQRQLNKNQVILHPSAIMERKIEEYKNDYRLVPKGEDKRNGAFFRLGRQLSYLALSIEEIERHLIDADYDNSRDVKSVMKQLKTPRYQPKFYHPLVYEVLEKRA
jgi:hypothetical protein